MVRTPITHSRLGRLIRFEVNARVRQGDQFTAYDITCALRAGNPLVEISHAHVRELVHRQMDTLVCSGLYQACPVDVGGRVALLYLPSPVLAPSGLLFAVMN
jgi:hypothetical protein